MKVYRRRPGVELLTICGEYLLVATKEARESCPYVTQINQLAAEYWQLMEDACTTPELVGRIMKQTSKEMKDVLLPVLAFTGKMSKAGYLLVEDIQ